MPHELRDLGRTVHLRRRRSGGRFVPVVAVLVVAAAVAARASDEDVATGDPTATAPAVAAEAAESAEAPADLVDGEEQDVPAVDLPVLGQVDGLLLHVPALDPVLVSYHEAAFAEALPISPMGTLEGNDNPTRALDHAADPAGLGFHVQVSRGRSNASTSAVDIVLDADEVVRAPVSGTVTDVRPYKLYGAHDDFRVELRPDVMPDHAVVLIHLEDVQVRAGDHIDVGDVLAAGARKFPFSAVVDRQTEPERYGHVHLEVKRPE